jgi:gamma-glutamylcyclotransferase (GGCT)/AIG2-like uncharacterized protein YtfP
MNDAILVFVYGLLMSGGTGFRALGLEARVRRLGPERITGRLYHLGHYPGLLTGRQGLVHGELLAFDDARLIDELDAYELYDPENPARSEYLRIEVDLLISGKRAWAYEYNRSLKNKPVIATGNWRTR